MIPYFYLQAEIEKLDAEERQLKRILEKRNRALENKLEEKHKKLEGLKRFYAEFA
ncbi:hypothetical protein EUX98_g935 [Antrodiella citrinella]|uniref:Uncharacterized protein n=1 Tax=Antrodiella citrinella TaxID=2447956 RepID=A0A4S4N4G2_9APHY|nr:hypothetical protein EUX98_g935 [Antrodiella citrinella]